MNFVKNFLSTRNLFFLAALVLIDSIFAYLVLLQGSDIHRENNLLENLQAAACMLACIIFAASATTVKGRHRQLAAFFSILCFIFFFRELDIEKFDVAQGIIFLLSDNRGRAIFFLADLALLAALVKEHRYFTRHRKIYLASDMFVFVASAALLLLVFSTAFDQQLIHVQQYILYEELSEFSAYYLLLVTAVVSLSEFHKIAANIHHPAHPE